MNNFDGTYDVTIPTGALSLGNHLYSFNATSAGGYMHIGNVDVTFTLRAHYTAVSVSGDFVTPYGEDTSITVVLIDLDTGVSVNVADVATFNYTSSYGTEILGPLISYTMDLSTNTWTVGPAVPVTLTITMSDPNYYAPDVYTFNVIIRAHRTSLTVTGVSTHPYSEQTPLTIILTDLDTGGTVPISSVFRFRLDWTIDYQDFTSPSSYDLTLDTSAWPVGVRTVTVITIMVGNTYETPSNYQFDVTIRSMTTVMYHDPSTLNFPLGVDFEVYLRLNISEPGVYYGDPITGRVPAEFSMSEYPFTIDATEQAIGRYKLTISNLEFPTGGSFEITVYFNSADSEYGDAFIVIQFLYRDVKSTLTSPNFPQVTTPYDLDVRITLNYTDIDFGSGIEGAAITSAENGTRIYSPSDEGGGIYFVWIDVSSLDIGFYSLFLTAYADGAEAKTLEFILVIRTTYTSVIPSVGSLTIPIGNSPTFLVDYTDTDRLLPIDNSTGDVDVISTWHNFSVEYVSGIQKYLITFHTSYTDEIRPNWVYTFTFSKGINYQEVSFNITVTIRTHNTEFRIVSSIEPTSTIGTFNISVYYGDLDSGVGVWSLDVDIWIRNQTRIVLSSFAYDTGQGLGFYFIEVPASQFPLGLQIFTLYADWTGAKQIYQNKSFVTTANVVGRESALTLLISSEPTPYDETMEFIFFYSDLYSEVGIDNVTGGSNVFIYVTFQGESVDLGQVIITEIDSVFQKGNYSIFFDTAIFSRTGLIYMNVFVNWSKGVSPYYSNRTDIISVRVLPRDTLLSITPPSPTSFGELGWFTFTYEDIIGDSYILDDPKLSITSNIVFAYVEIGGVYNFTFDTTQFGNTGTHAIQLSVTWDGIPFYSNRTGRTVYITVINRVTFLEYLAPAPTQYLDEVIFNVTWTDITGVSSVPITGATVTLYDGLTPIDGSKYNVYEYLTLGIYEITLNTTFASTPGYYNLRVGISIGATGIPDAFTTRTFNVRERLALLAAEPISTVPYNSSIVAVLYYQDLFTTGIIANESSQVTLEILDGPGSGPWYFTVTWRSSFGDYLLEVQTYNLGLETGITYYLNLRMSYAYQAPFYSSDELIVSFQVRDRVSSLSLSTEPETTPYGGNAVFTVFFSDVDAGGTGIFGATISIPSLTPIADYNVTSVVAGYYTITVDTAALGSPSSYPLSVHADWFGAPYHINMTRSVTILVRARETNIDITIPPSQTLYLDDVTFTFQYIDLDASSVPITLITAANIHLYWENATEINQLLYIVTPVGSSFEITISSDVLAAIPISGLSVTLEVDWNAATAPYYKDDSTIVKVTITGRTLLVETDQIDRTPKNDILNISITVTDINTGDPISTAIILFSCQGHSLVEGVDYTRTSGGGIYNFHIETSVLAGTGTFFFDITVQWDPNQSPFYANQSTITLTGLVDLVRTSLTVDAIVPSSVQFTGDVSLLITWRDIDHDLPISGKSALIESGVSYLVSGLPPAALVVFETGTPGVYNISFSTSDLSAIGSYTLEITAGITPYASSTVTPQFSVVEINTELRPLSTSQLYNWTDTAYIYVDYRNLLDDALIPGATVSWSIGGAFGDYLDEPGVPGQYRAIIDTDVLGFSGTQVVQITASLDKYTIASTTVTLVILALPSDIVVIDPSTGVLDVNRGNPVDIRVRLNDTARAMWIAEEQVLTIYVTFNAIQYSLTWDVGSNSWIGDLPGSATILDPGSYDVQITAGFYDYQAAGDQFRINVRQTETQLDVRDPETGLPLTDISAVFQEVIHIGLNLTEKASNGTIDDATVYWYESGFENLNVTFIFNATSGLWELEFNTSLGLYGTWGLTFRAFPNNPLYASSTATLTLTIRKIETEVWAPPVTIEVDWGWVDYISFTYYDISFDRGVDNASVTYDYGPFTGLHALDLGNGTYLILINTTYLASNAQYRIIMDFQKKNYEERTSGANLFVKLRSTELQIISDENNQVGGDPTQLQIPMGDTFYVTFFYNDTSEVGGLTGGLAGAIITPNTLYAGTGFGGQRNFTLVDLGEGYYQFFFDTANSELYTYFDGVPQTGLRYFFTISLEFDHRASREVEVVITVIDIPTEYIVELPMDMDLIHGDIVDFRIYVNDTWHNRPVIGAKILTDSDPSLTVLQNTTSNDGWYLVQFRADAVDGSGTIDVVISLEYHEDVVLRISAYSAPNDTDVLIGQVTSIGLPISLLIITLLGLYVRVWSVPKRIRQINGQIKALRRGRVPKPIGDVKSRRQIVADLFNDTYEKMKITRTAQQMPEDAIPIEVPEMGELLMQLAILTHLSQEELDEFQADIIKMKMSEQAAFVKEVINQEAMRVARREGKPIDEVLQVVEAEALRRLGAEEEVVPMDVIDKDLMEPVFLEEEEVVTPEEPEVLEEEEVFEEVTDTTSEKMSLHEIEELRKDLERRGVPPYEIDTIIEQAKELPRELVDELVKSLEDRK
ncbi:MAG: hypothetical protein ACFFEE_04030 [Candidatus Thorarchaeota archaeon]